jgi:hypothetical protein
MGFNSGFKELIEAIFESFSGRVISRKMALWAAMKRGISILLHSHRTESESFCVDTVKRILIVKNKGNENGWRIRVCHFLH